MRRLFLFAGVLAVAGCSDVRDLFSARADTAAEAGSLALTPERLAEILTGPKGVRLNTDAANLVTGMWVDYALFAQAVAQGELPADSVAVAQALWPVIAEIRSGRWHDTLVARQKLLSATAVDSAYGGDDVRIFQHALFTASQTATPEERSAARLDAENMLRRVKAGSNFGELAARLSKDPQSAQDNGFLPPGPRGQFVTAFDSAGWQLQPGEVSDVIETPFGYHVIRRPTVAEVRDRFTQMLETLAVRRIDSLYFDKLAEANDLEIKASAPGQMRDALEEREDARGSGETLATFDGGKLTVGEFLRWVDQLPPPYQQQLMQMPDSIFKSYARTIAQNILLLREADSAKIALTPVEWQGMHDEYSAQVDSLKAEMGLGADISDTNVSLAEREKLAEMKVETYFDRLIRGELRMRRIPASLSQVLRDELAYEVHPAGVALGLQLAQRAQVADSTSGAGAGQQPTPGGMQPAPGPPPQIMPAPADTQAGR